MDILNYEDLITDCLKICDDINDNNVDEIFPKLDTCLELSENIGREKILFQKSLLGIVRRCRKNFLQETKLSYKDVSDIANYFSEYIRELMHLDGIEINSDNYSRYHNTNKRSMDDYCNQLNFTQILIILIVLAILTLILGICTCWICTLMRKKQDEKCSLILPKEMMANFALTCQEMGLDPCEMRILKEKTCFDKEYENIVNKYLQQRSESTSTMSINECNSLR